MTVELLTANEVSTRLGVDRSTVYRMATDGRLRAVKVGSQWRFPPAVIDEALRAEAPGTSDTVRAPMAADTADVPLHAARTAVLEAVTPMLNAMMIVADMDGRLITDVVNPCPWFAEHGNDPAVLEACMLQWRAMAADHDFTPRFDLGPHGFVCARSFVRDGDQLVGMLIAGGIGPDPADPAGSRAAGFHHLNAHERAELLHALPRIAASLSALTSPHHSRDTRNTT